MDGLSLLCNLHSDGPLALRRLRAAGVNELGDLEGVPEAALAGCLRSSPSHARRFVAEARQLALRLVESPLEPEPLGEQHGQQEQGPEEDARAAEPYTLGARARRLAGHAVHVTAGEHVLEAGALDGLDPASCERLTGAGVLTLEALQERAGLALARSAGIPLAKLLDLALRARHFLTPSARETKPELRAHAVVPEPSRRPFSLAGRSVAAPRFPSTAAGLRHAVHARATEPGPAGPFG